MVHPVMVGPMFWWGLTVKTARGKKTKRNAAGFIQACGIGCKIISEKGIRLKHPREAPRPAGRLGSAFLPNIFI